MHVRPSVSSMDKLKRIGRYLIDRPSAAAIYRRQKMPDCIEVFTDSDWAGDKLTRKSVTGGHLRLGSCTLRTWSKDQTVIAKSSAEAELYAANYGAAQAIGLQSMMKEIGIELPVLVRVDASATIGIVHRRGLGKMRHLDGNDLWLQEAVFVGKVAIQKVTGEENTADLGTKPLTANGISTLMELMEFAF